MQNNFKELIFLLICICIDGIVLLPILIYENSSNDLQNIWFEDFDIIKNQIYFVTFSKNWINKNLELF